VRSFGLTGCEQQTPVVVTFAAAQHDVGPAVGIWPAAQHSDGGTWTGINVVHWLLPGPPGDWPAGQHVPVEVIWPARQQPPLLIGTYPG
jgi:hypothetical protein